MIRVTAGIIRDERGRVLVARRAPGQRLEGVWEFPGGKLEPGEAPEACLARELGEELGIEVSVGAHLATSTHRYDWGEIELLAYDVRWTGGALTLEDHDAIDWVEPSALSGVGLAPADVPIAREVARRDRTVIDIVGLSKSYGQFVAVRDLTLDVNRGEIVAFLGPNGAGKTTTIRMLMGMLVPTGGRATILGLDCFVDRVELKRHIGFLPDNPTFLDYMRGREVLEFVGEMHGMSRAEARARAVSLLSEYGLTEASEEYATNYSTGMKKKLCLAAATVHEPAVLILDEPTNGLDPRAAHEVDERLGSFASAGRTVFLSTHLLDRAQRLCTRVAIVDEGRLVAFGPIDELRENLGRGGTLEDVFLKVTERNGSENGQAAISPGAPPAPGPDAP